MTETIVTMEDVSRTYQQGGDKVQVLDAVNLTIGTGEMVALTGPSGSGKSTLLHQVGLLERPDKGDVVIDTTRTRKMSDRGRTRLRREKLGFIYQFHHLLPEFSALENVIIPQLIAGLSRRKAASKAKEMLARLNMDHRENHRPGELSGGEQQRVAIARALVREPLLLLADEPTGNLDEATSETVFGALMDIITERKTAALIATHNQDLAKRMTRHLTLQQGKLEEKTT